MSLKGCGFGSPLECSQIKLYVCRRYRPGYYQSIMSLPTWTIIVKGRV